MTPENDDLYPVLHAILHMGVQHQLPTRSAEDKSVVNEWDDARRCDIMLEARVDAVLCWTDIAPREPQYGRYRRPNNSQPHEEKKSYDTLISHVHRTNAKEEQQGR